VLDEPVERPAHTAPAQGREAVSLGVAVEHRAAPEFEFRDYGFLAEPVHEGVLDGLTLAVMADGAFAAVAVVGLFQAWSGSVGAAAT